MMLFGVVMLMEFFYSIDQKGSHDVVAPKVQTMHLLQCQWHVLDQWIGGVPLCLICYGWVSLVRKIDNKWIGCDLLIFLGDL
jgi:hypothetical protein